MFSKISATVRPAMFALAQSRNLRLALFAGAFALAMGGALVGEAHAGYVTTVCDAFGWCRPVYVPTCNPYTGWCG